MHKDRQGNGLDELDIAGFLGTFGAVSPTRFFQLMLLSL